MATIGVQYDGAEPCSQPALGFTGERAWQPGESRELPESLATHLLGGAESPFSRVSLKVARADDPPAPLSDEALTPPEPAAVAAEGSTT